MIRSSLIWLWVQQTRILSKYYAAKLDSWSVASSPCNYRCYVSIAILKFQVHAYKAILTFYCPINFQIYYLLIFCYTMHRFLLIFLHLIDTVDMRTTPVKPETLFSRLTHFC